MCLTFPVYYPRMEGKVLDLCASLPSGNGLAAVQPFINKYGPYVKQFTSYRHKVYRLKEFSYE